MNRFCATTKSEAVVAAPRADIWKVLTDPDLLVELTPLLRRIDVDGDRWRWHLVTIAALGVSIKPAFTELMRFDDERRIEFSHHPPPGVTERQGANGYYELSDAPGGTHLKISLTLQVELPLPKLSSGAVNKVIAATMQRMGDRFSANLLHQLGVEPSPVP